MTRSYDRKQRQQVRESILDACKATGEYNRRQMFAIRLALFSRRHDDDIDDLADNTLSDSGAVKADGGIDLEKLAAFIKEILPVILEFIKQLIPLFVAV